MRTRKGVERDMLVKARVLRVGDRDVAVGMFHDITERRQSEQQLREVNDAIDSINDWLPTAPVPSQGESQPIGYWTAERPDA